MPPPGVHAHAAALMRSLLFVPADGGSKLDKAMASGADAVIVDLEDSISAAGKAAARKSAAAFLARRRQSRRRALACWCASTALQTGLTDADLDAIVPARPDAIMLPKAEGGAAVIHADAKLAVREAISGLPDGHIKIVAIATETAAALFLAGTYRGASARLEGLTWGAEDLSAELGAEANRDADGRFLDPYRLARALCLAGAAAAQVQAIDTVTVDFRNDRGAAPRNRGSAPRRLHRQDGDPSGAGAGHQRGVHADRRRRSPRRGPSSPPSPPIPARAPSASTG